MLVRVPNDIVRVVYFGDGTQIRTCIPVPDITHSARCVVLNKAALVQFSDATKTLSQWIHPPCIHRVSTVYLQRVLTLDMTTKFESTTQLSTGRGLARCLPQQDRLLNFHKGCRNQRCRRSLWSHLLKPL